jgi:c(7)-type cytochrome triheme protein
MSTRVVALAVVLALGLGVVMAAPGLAQPKSPPDFTLEQHKDSPGKVTFSHAEHMKKAEKCSACHTKVFKMKKGGTGDLSMEKMKAGETCGTCHNGKAAFTVDDKANCEKCHKK